MNQTGRAKGNRLGGKSRRTFAIPLALALTIVVVGLGAVSALAVSPPLISATAVSQITASEATLQATVNPGGAKTEYRFEYLTDAAYQENPEANRFLGATRAPEPSGVIPSGEADVPVIIPIAGLTPATVYHFRLIALNSKGTAVGPEKTFATYPTEISGLPDGRAYEQASPVNKDGGDVLGTHLTVKAAPDGGGVTFISTVGVPGGVGAQEMPLYLASRGSNWSTQGLLPPPSFGETVRVIGWTPDFANFYESAIKFGEPLRFAFLQRPRSGGPIVEVAPYTPKGRYDFAGASADGSEVIFESPNNLATTPAGLEGHSNVYAWDSATGKLSLASVLNKGEVPSKEGSFAGPYDWIVGENAKSLGEGGSARQYYTQDSGAISKDGAVVFTAGGSGQLYLRLNPTEEQSKLNGQEECEEAAKACTLHLSASKKSNGKGKESHDVAGERPAAFMAATHEGSKVFFTSGEKLTNDANTGPEPAPPTIGRVELDGETDKTPKFIDAAATGMAVFGEHIYWANPSLGTIGRAKLNGAGGASEIDDSYISPGSIEVEVKAGEFESVPSRPQYVAVANGYVYWSDATDGKDGHGVIGRAKLGATEGEEVEAEFITGASRPQGIAADASTIYWANAGEAGSARSIGAAQSDGSLISQECIGIAANNDIPQGVALDASHLYWTLTSEFVVEENGFADYVVKADLACEGQAKNEKSLHVGHNYDVRGIAVDGGHVYWVEQRKGAIGRADLELKNVEQGFLTAEGSLKGVTVDGEHIYWSANGEVPANPGNDLYRYDAVGPEAGKNTLTDVTVDEKDTNGAEVKGVLGIAEDGSSLYFAANGDLDGSGPASKGSCKGALGETGVCNLYRWEEDGSAHGKATFIAQLDVSGGAFQTDAANWVGSPTGIFLASPTFRKNAWVSADGQTLLFRSQHQQTAYDNEGLAELYRYRAGEGILCVSCNPSGAPPSGPVLLGSINPSASIPATPAAIASRNLAAGGERVFFESTDALVPADTNGEEGCPSSVGGGSFPRCLDVYEWEAPGTGGCGKGAPAFSPQNGGCLYLLSTGKSSWPSFFIDASASGDDAFFFTREGLVGQDKDELLDVYDARVGGGIAAQNPVVPPPCEGSDACHGPVPPPPAAESPGSASFTGPANPKPKRQKAKKKGHKKHRRHHAKGRASR